MCNIYIYIYAHTHTHVHICIYIYIYIYIYTYWTTCVVRPLPSRAPWWASRAQMQGLDREHKQLVSGPPPRPGVSLYDAGEVVLVRDGLEDVRLDSEMHK